jgi:predicted DNA-binding transcriptional regulator YafY
VSITDRIGRLLFIVPYVAHRGGVPLKELAEKTGVDAAQIEADLDLLAMVGQPPLTPDHLIDLYVEDDIVYADLDQSLSRPLTLTHEEARALVLGAKLVGSLGGVGQELEVVLNKILALLNPVDQEIVRSLSDRIGMWQDSAPSLAPVAELRAAVTERREVELQYYSASSDRQKRYRLQPLALMTHTGVEYLVAHDVGADGQEKLFRLDRMADIKILPETFTAPVELDLERFRRARIYAGDQGSGVEVRFSADVAEQVRERFADSPHEIETGGTIKVCLNTSSPAWLARWVLPFGTSAEVIGPEEQRQYVARLCAEAAEVYGRDP